MWAFPWTEWPGNKALSENGRGLGDRWLGVKCLHTLREADKAVHTSNLSAEEETWISAVFRPVSHLRQ